MAAAIESEFEKGGQGMDASLLIEKGKLFEQNPPDKYKPQQAKAQLEDFQKGALGVGA
jgi:hypothetical protein